MVTVTKLTMPRFSQDLQLVDTQLPSAFSSTAVRELNLLWDCFKIDTDKYRRDHQVAKYLDII